MRAPNAIQTPQVPQIRNQANIAQRHHAQLANLANQVALANAAHVARFGQQGQVLPAAAQAQARAMVASVQAAQAQAQAQAQGQVAGASLAAGAAPALQAHLSPPYNAARAASSSPGIVQQSPPHQQAVIQNPIASPRPPSAQPQMGAMVQGPSATAARVAPALAHYYGASVPNASATQQFSPEQLRQVLIQVRHIVDFRSSKNTDSVSFDL